MSSNITKPSCEALTLPGRCLISSWQSIPGWGGHHYGSQGPTETEGMLGRDSGENVMKGLFIEAWGWVRKFIGKVEDPKHSTRGSHEQPESWQEEGGNTLLRSEWAEKIKGNPLGRSNCHGGRQPLTELQRPVEEMGKKHSKPLSLPALWSLELAQSNWKPEVNEV